MITDSQAFGDALLDEAVVARMVPWPCPSEFGPDGRYRLEEIIGVGQTSLVYRAVDTHMSSDDFDAQVAIKIVANEGRQRQEALNARRVRHDNVVRILDRGAADNGAAYIVQELVEGPTLETESTPWPTKRAAAFMIKVARGLQAVHTAGVVHCDLKPANVLITARGEPRITDFGLAAAGEEDLLRGGNLAFMSPERFADADAGLAPATDVYALAGLFYYLLTGVSPNGTSPEQVEAFLRSDLPAPSPYVHPVLDAICARGLSRDPSARSSAGEFADDLESWLRHEPIHWTKPSRPVLLRLFLRRHVVGVVVTAVSILGFASFIGSSSWVAWQQSQNELQAKTEALEIANRTIESSTGAMKASIEALYNMTFAMDLDVTAEYLASGLWLDQITEHPIVENLHRGVELEHVRRLSATLHERGRSAEIESLLADYTLAYLLLYDGEHAEARVAASHAVTAWRGRIAENEPIWRSLNAVHQAATMLDELDPDADASGVIDRLSAIEATLAGCEGCRAARVLMIQIRASLEG